MDVILAALAAGAAGLVAGLSVDRAVVALPAWRHVGLAQWAAFSRSADLGNGLALYPALGVAPLVLLTGTAIALWIGHPSDPSSVPLYAALALSVPPLFATARAAPNMLALRRSDDPAALRVAFERFERWHAARTVLQLLSLAAAIWALVDLAGR